MLFRSRLARLVMQRERRETAEQPEETASLEETAAVSLSHQSLRNRLSECTVNEKAALTAVLRGETYTEAAEVAGTYPQTVQAWARSGLCRIVSGCLRQRQDLATYLPTLPETEQAAAFCLAAGIGETAMARRMQVSKGEARRLRETFCLSYLQVEGLPIAV